MPERSEVELGVPVYVNEFWTAGQRRAASIHEISYRACFKPQLPRFYIERLSEPGDLVYDPFMGRGTTLIEAALLGRVPVGCDVSPLCDALVRPRLELSTLEEVAARLDTIDLKAEVETPEDLLTFYHPETLRALGNLRRYFIDRSEQGTLDRVDRWIRMVAINRLTGHSPGFFSVYSMPPNQAVSVKSQRKINERRNQVPPPRDVPGIILKKSKRLFNRLGSEESERLREIGGQAQIVTCAADQTNEIASGSVQLVVTSPPFLDIVDYATDNWLRCWFVGVDADSIEITVPKKLDVWESKMNDVFFELERILRPGGYVAFEVGEVRKGTIRLESVVLRCGYRAGLEPGLVMINDQEFTKTANCWGVDNNSKGTNTNRIVVFSKPA